MKANLILAIVSAALLVAIHPEFDLNWLAPVAITPLLMAAGREPRPLQRFLIGEVAGITTWFGVCYWIQFVLVEHGRMTTGLSWLAMVIFCIAKALHMGVFALLAGPLLRLRWAAAPAIAALWTGLERTHGPLGFAWLTLGNAGIDMGLPLRLAPVVGVYGLSFVFALMSATLVLAIHRRPRHELAWVLILPALYLLPKSPEPKAGAESAVVLQPNLAQKPEWTDVEVRNMHERLVSLTLESAMNRSLPKPTVILWPEVPAPLYYYNDASFRERVTQVARLSQTDFLFGAVSFTQSGAPLNSAVLLNSSGELVSRYDKMYLVPFGEFVPPLFSWVSRITNEAGDFQPGENLVVSKMAGHTAGTFICYESAFPGLVRQFTERGAEVLINITNDGYFGRTAARQQHLSLGRMRAAENGRWVLRATNDGWTVSIDPAGRIASRLPPFEELAGRLEFSFLAGMTPYARFGDWFAWLCLVGGFAASAWIARSHIQFRRRH